MSVKFNIPSLQRLSLIKRADVRNFYIGNICLSHDEFKQAIISYREALKSLANPLRGNWPEKLWPEKQFFINQNYNLIYAPIPKIACTSIKLLLLSISQVQKEKKEEIFNESHLVHRYMLDNFALSNYNHQTAQAAMNSNQYFKFIIVRNPWERLSSAYLHCFVRWWKWFLRGKTKTFPTFAEEVIKVIYARKKSHTDFDQSITFRQFIEYLTSTKNNYLNIHWKPQYLFFGSTNFNFIGRFEKLDEDFQYIQKQVGINFELPKKNRTSYIKKYNDTQNYADLYPSQLKQLEEYPKSEQLYDSDLLEIVKKRYKKDVELFGYQYYLE